MRPLATRLLIIPGIAPRDERTAPSSVEEKSALVADSLLSPRGADSSSAKAPPSGPRRRGPRLCSLSSGTGKARLSGPSKSPPWGRRK